MKRSQASAFVGTLLAFALLGWLVWRLEDRDALWLAFQRAARNPGWLAAGVAAFGVALLCCTLRWLVLLRALALPLSARRAVQLYAVGHFFNVVVPGSTGGDVVKATFAALDSPGRRPEAVASILVERVAGLVALCMLVALVVLLRPAFFAASETLRALRVFTLGVGIGVPVAVGVALGRDWSRQLPGLSRARRRFRWLETFVRLYLAARHCAGHPRALVSVTALSFANHLINVVSIACLGRALGLPVRGVDYLTVVPVVNAISALPVTPGGAGLRETAMYWLLGVAGAAEADATAASLLAYGAIIFWALIGGLCHLALRKRQASQPSAARM